MKSSSLCATVAAAGLLSAVLLGGCAAAGASARFSSGVVLGPSLAPPAELDPKYTPAALQSAFAAGCAKTGLRIRELAVDDSDLPFLLYGVLETRGTHEEIKAAVAQMPGYRYLGSASSRRDGVLLFALNVTPPQQYSADRDEAYTLAQATAGRQRNIVRQLDPRSAERAAR